MQKFKLYLLPSVFIWIGLGFIVVGLLAGYLYFSGERPEFLNFEMYALYSSKLRAKYFTTVHNNVLDELAGGLTLLGLLLMFFSKTKNENQQVLIMRIDAVFQSVVLTSLLGILLFIFVYGWPIFAVLSVLFYLFLLFSFLLFRIKYATFKSK
ncbi:MAG: hypothetical protein JXR50_07395 [Prolixibacteraceae bacterium]|nr:hypothetical protein [Prolixibacteraceae bacterium]MBN2649548.1 hypothetical protein [Prolixibacteraceae bacterium]